LTSLFDSTPFDAKDEIAVALMNDGGFGTVRFDRGLLDRKFTGHSSPAAIAHPDFHFTLTCTVAFAHCFGQFRREPRVLQIGKGFRDDLGLLIHFQPEKSC
jgi:hypothetical protein